MSVAPTVKGHKLFFLLNLKRNFLPYLGHLYEEYGDIVHKYYKGGDHYFTRNPEHAEYILTTNQDNYRKSEFLIASFKPYIGENSMFINNNTCQWQQDRNVSKAYFEASVFFENYAKTISEKCGDLINNWHQQLSRGESEIPIRVEIDKLLTYIISDTIFCNFDMDVDDATAKAPILLDLATEKISSSNPLKWILPTKINHKHQEYRNYELQRCRKLITSRIEKNKDYDDLLGAWLHLYHVIDKTSPNFDLIINHLRFFTAVSYINTSAVLAWAAILLAKNPEVAQRIAEEASKLSNGGALSYSDFCKLTYTQAVVCEVLRLYPPATYLFRENLLPDDVVGYSIPDKSTVLIGIYHMHRHPDYWDNPEEFNPERFIGKPWGQDYQYAYLPFGAGKRACLAKNFAFMEVCMMIAMIYQHFHLSIPKGSEVNMRSLLAIQIRPTLEKMLLQPR